MTLPLLAGCSAAASGAHASGAAEIYGTNVAVRKGDTVIEVAGADASDSTTYPTLIAVAKTIIAQLG